LPHEIENANSISLFCGSRLQDHSESAHSTVG
jgi:hypothetical protein